MVRKRMNMWNTNLFVMNISRSTMIMMTITIMKTMTMTMTMSPKITRSPVGCKQALF